MQAMSEHELHEGPRPEFVERHPFAIVTDDGGFHSRYSTLICAARTLLNGSIRRAKQRWFVKDERTGKVYEFSECYALVRREDGLPGCGPL